jgi:myo-inositol-1(or 4)-monophosphatase
MSELDRMLDFARGIMYEAGRLTLGYFYRRLEVIAKSDGSPVTIADREAEALVRKAIEEAFPDHGITGEEWGKKEPRAGCSYTWFIDPIDGTKSFIHGVPLYTNLLGLLREDRSVVGVVNIPALGEQVSAREGGGTTLNGRRVQVSSTSELSESVVLTSDSRDLALSGPSAGWKDLWKGCKFPRSWGDAYGHVLVATGRAEIMLDARAEPYDLAPLPVILREAGGQFFDWSGNETIFGKCGASVNDALAEEVRRALDSD